MAAYTIDVRTGRTIDEMWQTLDATGKRAWLLKRGLRVIALAGEKRGSEPLVTIEGGEYSLNALSLATEKA